MLLVKMFYNEEVSNHLLPDLLLVDQGSLGTVVCCVFSSSWSSDVVAETSIYLHKGLRGWDSNI